MTKNKVTSGIGYSPLTERIYMGRQNQSKGMWVGDKKDVTHQFIDCAFSYFEEGTVRTITIKEDAHLFIHIKRGNAQIDRIIKYLQNQKSPAKKSKNGIQNSRRKKADQG